MQPPSSPDSSRCRDLSDAGCATPVPTVAAGDRPFSRDYAESVRLSNDPRNPQNNGAALYQATHAQAFELGAPPVGPSVPLGAIPVVEYPQMPPGWWRLIDGTVYAQDARRFLAELQAPPRSEPQALPHSEDCCCALCLPLESA